MELENQMLGLHQYLNDLNNLSLDTEKVTLDELDNIRSKFAQDQLDDYSKRKYIWKLIATKFFLQEDFINPKSPLGLEQALECLQNANQLDVDCAWNAINVIYGPIMSESHWEIVLNAVKKDFKLLEDKTSQGIVGANLIGLSLNLYFIPDSLSSELQNIFNSTLENTLQSELCRESLILLGAIIPKYQESFIGKDNINSFINKLLSFLKIESIPVFNIVSSLSDVHSDGLVPYQGQLLEFYSYLSNRFINEVDDDNNENDKEGEMDKFQGVSTGWELSRFVYLLIKLSSKGLLAPGSSYYNLLLKITDSNLKSIESEKLQSVKSKDAKLLLGSIYINLFKLKIKLGDTVVVTDLLSMLAKNLKSTGSIFTDTCFKIELINTIKFAFENTNDSLKLNLIYKVLKFGKLFKKLLHTKNDEICESIQLLLLKFSEYPLDFAHAKIILVILFDKFIRVDQKSSILQLILKAMENLLNSGVVRYSILKLIKCWITLGAQGDDYWLLALELVKFSVSNSNSGVENGSLSNLQLHNVDQETLELREQIIDFVYLGLLSIPDNKVNDHESFFLLSLSILKLNAKYWLIGDIGKQINAIITKYPVSSNVIKKCILQTFVDYYPLVDSKYKSPVINLLNTLSLKDDTESSLVKSSKLCFNVLNGELRFMKFDQGILVDFNDIKVMYRANVEEDVISVTFNCILKEEIDGKFNLSFSENEESKWKIIDKIIDRSSSTKAKFAFKFELKSFYGIQDEPVLNITTTKGDLTIRICILMKMIQFGGQMTKQSFDQRWEQVLKSLGDTCYDSRNIEIDGTNVVSIQRILQRMGFGIVSIDSNGSTLAIGLLKMKSISIGVMVKFSNLGDLEVVCTQGTISNFISSRLEMVICSELCN